MSDDDDDAPPTAEEAAEARRLAGLVDGLIAGAPVPPVLPAAQRELVETAAAIRATRPISDDRRDAVLRQVFAAPRRTGTPLATTILFAAAAILFLAIRPLPPPSLRGGSALVGRIDAADVAEARARLDLVYADRLSGYRRQLLDGRAP